MLLLGGKAFVADLVELSRNRGFIMLAGFFGLTIGLVSVILHGTWSPDWAGVVTALGWLAIVGGVMRIMLPQLVRRAVLGLVTNSWVVFPLAFMCVALGVGLLQFSL